MEKKEEIDLSKIEEVFTNHQPNDDYEKAMVEFKDACNNADIDEKVELAWSQKDSRWSISILKKNNNDID